MGILTSWWLRRQDLPFLWAAGDQITLRFFYPYPRFTEGLGGSDETESAGTRGRRLDVIRARLKDGSENLA